MKETRTSDTVSDTGQWQEINIRKEVVSHRELAAAYSPNPRLFARGPNHFLVTSHGELAAAYSPNPRHFARGPDTSVKKPSSTEWR